jgi:hypothetical protein
VVLELWKSCSPECHFCGAAVSLRKIAFRGLFPRGRLSGNGPLNAIFLIETAVLLRRASRGLLLNSVAKRSKF